MADVLRGGLCAGLVAMTLLGCGGPQTVPVAVYGDVRVRTGTRKEPVYERRQRSSALPRTPHRLAIGPFDAEGPQPGLPAHRPPLGVALARQLRERSERIARLLGERCTHHDPCFSVVSPETVRALAPEQALPSRARAVHEAHGTEFLVTGTVTFRDGKYHLRIRAYATPSGEQAWSAHLRADGRRELVQAAMRRLVPHVRKVQVGSRQLPTYETYRMVVGVEEREIDVAH